MKIFKIRNAQSNIFLSKGFTILELIVVVAVLTILGGMAAPSVMAYIRTAHVNEGKALLNAAVSDCLRTAGSTPQNLATTTPVTLQEALAGTRATPLGYTIEKDPHCSTGLSLKATTPGMIDLYAEVKSDGTVIKKAATQANDTSSSSQVSCEQWGGKANCQDAAEIARQKAAAIAAALAAAEAERARLAAIEKQKAEAALAAAAAAEAASQAAIAQQAARALALSQAASRVTNPLVSQRLQQASAEQTAQIVARYVTAPTTSQARTTSSASAPSRTTTQNRRNR